jgi:hypothetical protein
MKGNDKLDAIYNGVNEHFKLFPISKELKHQRKYKLPDNYFSWKY